MRAIMLLVIALVATSPNKPSLTVRAFPMMSLAGPRGCSSVLVTAEIVGPEDENWYCPKIEWEMPDSTNAVEESDCSPFEKRHQCLEDQTGCGMRGFRLNPITDQYEDVVKECACTISGYPRIWRRRICAPAHPNGDEWSVWVRLSKNNKTIARQEIRFWVKG